MGLAIGTISYALAALAFAILTGLLAVSQRDKSLGVPLMSAAGLTGVWATMMAYAATHDIAPVLPALLEIVRDGAWLLLLWKIFESSSCYNQGQQSRALRRIYIFGISVFSGVFFYSLALHAQVLPSVLDFAPLEPQAIRIKQSAVFMARTKPCALDRTQRQISSEAFGVLSVHCRVSDSDSILVS